MANIDSKTAETDPRNNALPAQFANRFGITVGPMMSRLFFGDAIEGTDAVMHTGIVLTTADLMELADTINDLIANLKGRS